MEDEVEVPNAHTIISQLMRLVSTLPPPFLFWSHKEVFDYMGVYAEV